MLRIIYMLLSVILNLPAGQAGLPAVGRLVSESQDVHMY